MKILFLHGWNSVPGGRKPTYLNDDGHEVINPALPDEDFDDAVRIAQAEFDQHHPDVVVGSSRGGAVAMNIDSGNTPLVLLCPAWEQWGSAATVKAITIILHSRQDDVVPFSDSEELVTNSDLPPEALIEVGYDHRLADSEPLKAMLDACESLKLVIIGIDPAPSKGLVIWDGNSATRVSAREASTWINQLRERHRNILMCWDSPLSFDPAISLSDRPVEKILRKQVKTWIDDDLIEQKAVSVLPFSGCSHWVISCEALGQPFATPESTVIPLARSSESVSSGGAWLIEAHPAVAMAVWWIEDERNTSAFPIYKEQPEACRRIADSLGFEAIVDLEVLDDDILDAYVAHRLALQFMSGECRWIGDSDNGGFVLPNSAETQWELNTAVQHKIQAELAIL